MCVYSQMYLFACNIYTCPHIHTYIVLNLFLPLTQFHEERAIEKFKNIFIIIRKTFHNNNNNNHSTISSNNEKSTTTNTQKSLQLQSKLLITNAFEKYFFFLLPTFFPFVFFF
ncbi:unnamed protein product [Ceratitis capitata]|uniref:(Mediterranean fruit fly) hypothetical protein n=1 Tax=Ceratitis capitata TaxID=7213 RepID=A0A811U858_CERCA|nr:unnamed protein product [Ceratitis capitata]